MSKKDLLLEIGLEEIPARFILDAEAQFKLKVREWFEESNIQFEDVKSFSTPRRLAVQITGVAHTQDDEEVVARGPARKIAIDEEGNWTKAAIGFSRSQGVSTEDIYFSEIKGVEYAHVRKNIKGELTANLLPELQKVVEGLHFPNSMRWGDHQVRYVRPIRWIVAIFGNEVIPFSIAGVEADVKTRGHRFLGEEIEITNPLDYEQLLEEQYVIADYGKRKRAVTEQIHQLEKDEGWIVPIEEDLLEEVTNLIEYPTVFFGSFNEEFLQLPEEVLITSMKSHQRYFPVKNSEEQLLPYFISVRNGNDFDIDTVAKGNEKVLRARLADADFFYEEDQKVAIEDALEKLQSIVYHEKIGTLAQKVNRVRKICRHLSSILGLSDNETKLVDRAAEISKFDLVTNMVDEFPELQGIMGQKYALQRGESAEVAQAINEHYQPRHAHDDIPSSTVGAVLSTADKLDTIVSSFAIGLIPTGSHDPYALRRHATGIAQILIQKDWNCSLSKLVEKVIEVVRDDQIAISDQLYDELIQFFKLRIKFILQEQGVRHDLIEAVLASEINSVPDLVDRANTLEESKEKSGFKETVESLSRVLNIAKNAESGIEIDEALFETEEEKNLYKHYKNTVHLFTHAKNATEEFAALSSMEPVITAYFDHTMVMAEDDKVRNNRLAQMKKLADLIEEFAKINEIHAK